MCSDVLHRSLLLEKGWIHLNLSYSDIQERNKKILTEDCSKQTTLFWQFMATILDSAKYYREPRGPIYGVSSVRTVYYRVHCYCSIQ